MLFAIFFIQYYFLWILIHLYFIIILAYIKRCNINNYNISNFNIISFIVNYAFKLWDNLFAVWHSPISHLINVILWLFSKKRSWYCFSYPHLSKIRGCWIIWWHALLYRAMFIIFWLLEDWDKILDIYLVDIHHLIVLLFSLLLMPRFCFYSTHFWLCVLFTVLLFLLWLLISHILTLNIILMLRKFEFR